MKRAFDITASILGLIFLLPLFFVVAILIRIKMPGGPVFFIQKRVGQNGKLFNLIKFRTMIVGHKGSTVSVKGESRITKMGAVLRKYKIDELPELWNIVKGEMSFVGPRPDVPGFADFLSGEDSLILKLKPGITGPASLKYANEEEILAKVENPEEYNKTVIYPDKVKLNLDYYYNHNLYTDIIFIFKTIFPKKHES
jgi:lipopolysaccharide/colanic/teichoic acid biosynthesis glycosyltransferase